MNKPLINPNFRTLSLSLQYGDKRGIVLEGGSRSGKTFSIIQFLIEICASNSGLVINIIKETYAGFKTTLYDDFNKILTGLPIDNPFAFTKDIQSFYIFSNKINFIGADQAAKFHGASCDYFWINEALDVSKAVFDQLEMRCRKAWILDYNPKTSEHWVFGLEKRPDVQFFHSTLLDNPFIGKWEKQKIMSCEPTDENIKNGTADDYTWKVYGLGLRASPKGLIFGNVTWIDRFPENIDRIAYGQDFGFTNSPTAIVRGGWDGGKNLYYELLFYAPVQKDKSDDLAEINRQLIGEHHIWCDSADGKDSSGHQKGMITELRIKGINAVPTKKWPGSIVYGIDFMKGFKIHIVQNPDARREAENYHWKEINGIMLNEPIDDFNHFWDAARYLTVMEFRA